VSVPFETWPVRARARSVSESRVHWDIEMYLRRVSDRTYELNRNKNHLASLRVGSFTRQDDGRVPFFPNCSADPYTLEMLINIQTAMVFLLNHINFEGEHHFI
jgi:hypothetical protein